MLHGTLAESRCHEDKHEAPTLPHIRPLSLQGAGGPFQSFPDVAGKIYRDAGGRFPLFPEVAGKDHQDGAGQF